MIARAGSEIDFVPIMNMTNAEVKDLLLHSRVYIDFGEHPGKDRIPREAAIMGLCVITGKRGAAANDQDVFIPDSFKFDEKEADLDIITDRIRFCLDNYDEAIADLADYRTRITSEKALFSAEVRELRGILWN